MSGHTSGVIKTRAFLKKYLERDDCKHWQIDCKQGDRVMTNRRKQRSVRLKTRHIEVRFPQTPVEMYNSYKYSQPYEKTTKKAPSEDEAL
jgi:hypothetical protein